MRQRDRVDCRGIRLPDSKCPTCGYTLDAATAADGSKDRPRKGDISICARCGEALIFGNDMTLHEMTADELAKLSLECTEELFKAQKFIRDRKKNL